MMSFTIAFVILSVKNVALITFISHNYVKIKVDSDISPLLVEKELSLHNVIIPYKLDFKSILLQYIIRKIILSVT